MLADFFINSLNERDDPAGAYFERGSDVLGATEQAKLRAIAEAHAQQPLDILGTASDDESYANAPERANLVHRRVEAVEGYLRQRGWKGKANIAEEVRNKGAMVDARRVRRVEVKVSAVPDGPRPELPPPHQAAPVAFETARKQAYDYTMAAAATLDPSHREYARVAELARRIFTADVDLKKLAVDVGRIAVFLSRITEWKPGVPDAPRPGFRFMIHGSSNLASTAGRYDEAVISFGPAMQKNAPAKQTFTFIHESAHAALNAHDVAYGYRRLFSVLDHAQATTNADSYAVFVVLAVLPDSRPRATPPAVDVAALSVPQGQLARKAVAEVETFLGLTAHDVDHVYRDVWSVLLNGKEWRGKYDEHLGRIRMAFPGELHADQLVRPDDIVLTGMHHRLLALRTRIEGPVTCTVKPDGEVTAGPGGAIALPVSFFALPTNMDRVRALVVALAAAEPLIPQPMRTMYAAVVVASARYREER